MDTEGPVRIPGWGSAGIFDLGCQDDGRGCPQVAGRWLIKATAQVAVRNT